MRLRMNISGVRFRVAGSARPRLVEVGGSKVQRTTLDKRPIWVVKLSAFDSGAGQEGSTEAIWVEVAGPKPELVMDELADVQGLVYAPWARINVVKDKPQAQIVRAFRAVSITMADAAKSRAA